MLQGEDILFLGVNQWTSILQRPQHLARGLSRRNRVLFVDPTAFSFVTKLASRRRAGPGNRSWRPRLTRLSASLHVYTPPPLFPFSLWSPAASRLNAFLLSRLLRKVIAGLGLRPGILWTSAPEHRHVPESFPGVVVCYDCMDNFPAFYEGRRRRFLAAEECSLLAKANVAFASDPWLVEKCRRNCEEVHLLQNAAAACFLDSAPLPCPEELAPLRRPVVGYVGTLSQWVDLHLLYFLAEQRPDWSVVVIGPRYLEAPRPFSFPDSRLSRGGPAALPVNLHLLGEKKHADLPAYIDSMDVCLAPFVPSELTQCVNPVKLYEYLARGKPVVATNTHGMQPFAEHCSLAADAAGFLSSIEAALRENPEDRDRRAAARIAFASKNTWEHRVQRIEEVLTKQLDRHRRDEYQGNRSSRSTPPAASTTPRPRVR